MTRSTNIFKRILRCRRGSVTIDWVVLTASCVLLGAAVSDPIYEGLLALLGGTATSLDAVSIPDAWTQ